MTRELSVVHMINISKPRKNLFFKEMPEISNRITDIDAVNSAILQA